MLAANVGDRDRLAGDRDVLLAQTRDQSAPVGLVELQRGLSELGNAKGPVSRRAASFVHWGPPCRSMTSRR